MKIYILLALLGVALVEAKVYFQETFSSDGPVRGRELRGGAYVSLAQVLLGASESFSNQYCRPLLPLPSS
ncbi:hypothetical protein E2C01_018770 [Portunus trituberculatus]|uniref:Uncharacterized protein n=1 Tax=Portunus trituberculatus TaxID=210409 RepID=A0A5B7DW55_PORTR|nr:hypothetical protein [Portunus trituberculatus]